MDITTPHYIYLLHTREFINCKMPVYKIGRTKQANLERFLTYPKGSVILLHTICNNCCSCEKKIISLFDKKYKKRTDFGNEYYEGNYKDMKKDINDIVEADNEIKENCRSDNEVMENEVIENEIISSNNLEITDNTIQTPINEVIQVKQFIKKVKFCCEKCGYYTNIKQHYENHNISKKHTQKSNEEFMYDCICKKKFITVGGLNKHKKNCQCSNVIIEKEEETPNKYTNTVNEILKKNNEINLMITELLKND